MQGGRSSVLAVVVCLPVYLDWLRLEPVAVSGLSLGENRCVSLRRHEHHFAATSVRSLRCFRACQLLICFAALTLALANFIGFHKCSRGESARRLQKRQSPRRSRQLDRKGLRKRRFCGASCVSARPSGEGPGEALQYSAIRSFLFSRLNIQSS